MSGKIKKILAKIREAQSMLKKATDFAGRPLPDSNGLPQEQTFTYPYPDGRLQDSNYNAEPTLQKKKEEKDPSLKTKKKIKLPDYLTKDIK